MEDINIKVTYCRICGIKCKTAVKIFSRKGRGMGLQDKILKCFTLSVRKCDLLPTRVCYTCIDRLDEFNQFVLLVKQAQIKLRTILKSKGVHVKEEKNSELISTWKAVLAQQEKELMVLGKGRKSKRKSEVSIDNSSDSISSELSSDSESSADYDTQHMVLAKDASAENEVTLPESSIKSEYQENASTSSKKLSKQQPVSQERKSVSSTTVTSVSSSQAAISNSAFPVCISEKSQISVENALSLSKDRALLYQQPLTPANDSNITTASPSQPIIIPSQLPNSMFVIQGANFNSSNGGVTPLYFLNLPCNPSSRVSDISQASKICDDTSGKRFTVVSVGQPASSSADTSIVPQSLVFAQAAEQNPNVSTPASIVSGSELRSSASQKPSEYIQPSIAQPNDHCSTRTQKLEIPAPFQSSSLFIQPCASLPNKSGQLALQNVVMSVKSSNFQSKEIDPPNKKLNVSDQQSNLNSDHSGHSTCAQPSMIHQVITPHICEVDHQVAKSMDMAEISKLPLEIEKELNCNRISSLNVPQMIAEELLSSESPPPVRFRIVHKVSSSKDNGLFEISQPSTSCRVVSKRTTPENNNSSEIQSAAVKCKVLYEEAAASKGNNSLNVLTVLDSDREEETETEVKSPGIPPLIIHEDAAAQLKNPLEMPSLTPVEQNDLRKCWTPSELSNSFQEEEVDGESTSLIIDEACNESAMIDGGTSSQDKCVKSSYCQDLSQSSECEIGKPSERDVAHNVKINAASPESDLTRGNFMDSSHKSQWRMNELGLNKVKNSQVQCMVRCGLCSEENSVFFNSMTSAMYHHQVHHAGSNSSFGCTKCNFVTGQLQNLRQHILANCSMPNSAANSNEGENLVPKVKVEESQDYEQALINLKNALRSVSMPRFRRLLTSCKAVLSPSELEENDVSNSSKSNVATVSSSELGECNLGYSSKVANDSSPGEKVYVAWKCSFCPKRFCNKTEMQNHLYSCQFTYSGNSPNGSPPEKKFKPMDDANNPLFTKEGSFFLCHHCGRKFSSMFKAKMHATRNKSCKKTNPDVRILIRRSKTKPYQAESQHMSSVSPENACINAVLEVNVGNSKDVHPRQSSAALTSGWNSSDTMIFDIPRIKVEKLDSPTKDITNSDRLPLTRPNDDINSFNETSVEKSSINTSDERNIKRSGQKDKASEGDKNSRNVEAIETTSPLNTLQVQTSTCNSSTNADLNLVNDKVENVGGVNDAQTDAITEAKEAHLSPHKTRSQTPVKSSSKLSKKQKNPHFKTSLQCRSGANQFHVLRPRTSLEIGPSKCDTHRLACDTHTSIVVPTKMSSKSDGSSLFSAAQTLENYKDMVTRALFSEPRRESANSEKKQLPSCQMKSKKPLRVILPKPFPVEKEVSPNKKWLREAEKFCMSKSQSNDPDRGLVLKVPLVKLQRLNLINTVDSGNNQDGVDSEENLLRPTSSTTVASNEERRSRTATSKKSQNTENSIPLIEPKEEEERGEHAEETIFGCYCSEKVN